jgi:hypothetical protein
MERKAQVFISSTYENLKEERQAIIIDLLRSGFIPAGMETFQSGRPSWTVIKRDMQMSDIYVLIIAGRYGAYGNDKKISFTELEYNYAIELGLEIRVFIYHNIDTLLLDSKESKHKQISLKRFIERIKRERLIEFWDKKEHLVEKVISAVINSHLSEHRGWFRNNYSLNQNYIEIMYNSEKMQPLSSLIQYIDIYRVKKVYMLEHSCDNAFSLIEYLYINKPTDSIEVQLLLANPSSLPQYLKTKVENTLSKLSARFKERTNFRVNYKFYHNDNIPTMRGRCIDNNILSMGWYTYETLDDEIVTRGYKQVHGTENPMFTHYVASEEDFLLKFFMRVFNNLWYRGENP